jgi:transcriptional regulator with GAF, ATPase, and Fis domain
MKLLSWIGSNDLKGPAAIEKVLTSKEWDISSAEILYDDSIFQKAAEDGYQHSSFETYKLYLERTFKKVQFSFYKSDLNDPTDYGDVFKSAEDVFSQAVSNDTVEIIVVNATSGTPTMHAMWILLSSTQNPARVKVVQVKIDGSVIVSDPSDLFDIYARVLPAAAENSQKALSASYEISGRLLDLVRKRSRAYTTFQKLYSQICLSQKPVLICGESGVGKELIAKAIAFEWLDGDLEEGFVAVNCAGLSEQLIEVELFGSKAGAFTGAIDKQGLMERANGGVLFLDELGELPTQCQSKLLRALQEKKIRKVGDVTELDVDFKLICATNRDLRESIQNKQFREDLFWRVANYEFFVPPLRKRIDELADITRDVLSQIDAGNNKTLTPEFLRLVESYSWPGNIRELEITIARACVNASVRGSKELEATDFHEALMKPIARSKNIHADDESLPINFYEKIDLAQVALLKMALKEEPKNRTAAAKLLSLNVTTFNNKCKAHGLL